MPGQDLDQDDGDKRSRDKRLRDKLNAKYDGQQGGPPQMTEEEKYWQMKEQQAATRFGQTRQPNDGKKYEMVFENQVDFVKADLMKGTLLGKRAKPYKEKFKSSSSGSSSSSDSESSNSSSDSEEQLQIAEKKLTPFERERI